MDFCNETRHAYNIQLSFFVQKKIYFFHGAKRGEADSVRQKKAQKGLDSLYNSSNSMLEEAA
jgi:hypothetical protein